jgi:hypothetical protein
MKIKNPKYNQNGTIDIEMQHPVFSWVTFTASPDDVEEHGRLIFAEAQSGKYGAIKPYEEKENDIS